MNQAELNRAIAQATTVSVIKKMGFHPVCLPIPERRFRNRKLQVAHRRRSPFQSMKRTA